MYEFAYVTTAETDFSEWNCYYSWDRSVNPFPTYPGYCNRDLDVANSRFNSELDPRAQLEAAAQAQYILMQDIVTIPLVLRPNIEIVRNTLANYKLTNTTTSSFWNARQWYFK